MFIQIVKDIFAYFSGLQLKLMYSVLYSFFFSELLSIVFFSNDVSKMGLVLFCCLNRTRIHSIDDLNNYEIQRLVIIYNDHPDVILYHALLQMST